MSDRKKILTKWLKENDAYVNFRNETKKYFMITIKNDLDCSYEQWMNDRIEKCPKEIFGGILNFTIYWGGTPQGVFYWSDMHLNFFNFIAKNYINGKIYTSI